MYICFLSKNSHLYRYLRSKFYPTPAPGMIGGYSNYSEKTQNQAITFHQFQGQGLQDHDFRALKS
jgi:hypothetical protein